MTLNLVGFLVGLFVVPVVLLWGGHKLRRGTRQRRRAFWGALVGHCVAGSMAIVVGLIPPESWTPTETTRGAVGLWGMLVLPLVGWLGAILIPSKDS